KKSRRVERTRFDLEGPLARRLSGPRPGRRPFGGVVAVGWLKRLDSGRGFALAMNGRGGRRLPPTGFRSRTKKPAGRRVEDSYQAGTGFVCGSTLVTHST